MVSIALLVACEKNAVIEKFNESIKQAPDARSHAKKILPVETIHQYDWAQQVPLFKNEQLVGVKVLHKNIVNNQLSYLIIHYNTGAFADVVLHEIQYEGKVGQSKPISIKSNNLSKNRIALLPLTAGSSNKDLDNGRNGTGKRSLVSPGGTLPMVTITGIYNNGSITAVTPTTYFLINGAFVNGGGGSSGGTTGGEGGTNPFDPYIYLDYLDPLYVPDAGSSGLPSEFNLNEYDYIDGTLYSRYNYPGINDGKPWRWWYYDTELEVNPENDVLGWETNTGINSHLVDFQFDRFEYGDFWPTITSVISLSDFVEYDRSNCLDLARQQIRKKGYCAGGFGQNMFQTYTRSSGINQNQMLDAIGYLHKALGSGIPVIVGVDYRSDNDLLNPNPDTTTDHFIVIVGSGVEPDGKQYFQFYDNASNYVSKGANSLNRLYYNPLTNELTGQTSVTYTDGTKLPKYKVTQVRKSFKC